MTGECQNCHYWGRIRQRAEDLSLPRGTCAVDGPATPKKARLPVTGYRDSCGRFVSKEREP